VRPSVGWIGVTGWWSSQRSADYKVVTTYNLRVLDPTLNGKEMVMQGFSGWPTRPSSSMLDVEYGEGE